MSFIRKTNVLNDCSVFYHPFSKQSDTEIRFMFEILHNRYSIWLQMELKS